MTERRRKRRKKKSGLQQISLPLLLVLCGMLIAVIIVAISCGKGAGDGKETRQEAGTSGRVPAESTALPDTAGSVSGTAEASGTETSEPVPGTKEPETKAPETKAPETKAPETKAPETKAPETKAPETKAPETKAPETREPEIPDDGKTATPYEKLGFLADISAYEEYMNPTGAQRDAYLLLVNTSNLLASDYVPKDLTKLPMTRKDGRGDQKMVLYAAKALEAMYKDAEANGMINDSTGYRLSVMSAYRPYHDQKYIFNDYVRQTLDKNPGMSRAEAEKKVSTYSAPPGTSEHQSGLCCDMHNQKSASSSHPEWYTGSPEMVWCMENCWKYGFVLRFPDGKQDVTGIKFEPWHYRYVGRYHAERMVKLGMCLEEYVEYLKTEK